LITNTVHFEFIQATILKELDETNSHVTVAVAWLTDSVLYHKLYSLCRKGKKVEILLNYDQINIASGLDFENIQKAGGKIFWEYESDNRLMHNKYCIIDDKTIITGSYNWTNRAKSNNENIVVIKNDLQSVAKFKNEFYRLTNQEKLISTETFSLNDYNEKSIKSYQLFTEWWKKSHIELTIAITERLFKRKFDFNYLPSENEYNTLMSTTALDLEFVGHLLNDYKSIIQDQLKDFDSLQAEYGYNLSGLEGLETFLHLEYLNASWNDIVELNPISHLTNLKYLDLSFNGRMQYLLFKTEMDLNPLSSLHQLEYLNLSSNKNLMNISSLYSLKTLRTLDLSESNSNENDINLLKSNLPDCEIITDSITMDSEVDYFDNDDFPF
jgi:hypothetical protein